MTRVIVTSGVCGFSTTIEVVNVAKRRARVAITSDCEMVTKLGESLIEVEQWELLKQHTNCKIYEVASMCHLHVACLVPIALLKAIEVEAGLALPRDVAIRFETVRHN